MRPEAMRRSASHDILFEPVRIGPVVTRNRFYQVAHCNGMGRAYPSSMAAMRGVKAEGGWGVVCTEQCEIHHSGNHERELRLWDDKDIPCLAQMADLVHQHGALAAIELVHNGSRVGNLETRSVPLAPSLEVAQGILPVSAREMTRADIDALRRWHRTAVANARRAGFDIIYIYAGHDISLVSHFLSRRRNSRTDEYGGSIENRARLLRELLLDAKETAGDTCAIAIRLGIDGPAADARGDEEARQLVTMLAELPDLWDINLTRLDYDAQSSRFGGEGQQEPFVRFVKTMTTKPVVGVGRFTSADRMAALIRNGTLDLIGAARPSIADPFLPRKIEEGRYQDIRECIGCNVCLAYDRANVPIRCTQNPTMGEEWRRGWHPERLPERDSDDDILVVGAGPAGLEAAMSLGRRGYGVILAEQASELGGRVTSESKLPGLAEWARVRDWRLGQLRSMPHVLVQAGRVITSEAVLDSGATIVALATGATWRADGVGRVQRDPISELGDMPVYTPDDIMAGRLPSGRVVVFDDDHYYMGGVVAELLAERGCDVFFVTPESIVSACTQHTSEQFRIHQRMAGLCADMRMLTTITGANSGVVSLACVYTGQETLLKADALVLVTSMRPNDGLYRELEALGPPGLRAHGIRRIVRIGDCLGPGIIAAAVYSGHLFARELDTGLTDWTPFRREQVALDFGQQLPEAGRPQALTFTGTEQG